MAKSALANPSTQDVQKFSLAIVIMDGGEEKKEKDTRSTLILTAKIDLGTNISAKKDIRDMKNIKKYIKKNP